MYSYTLCFIRRGNQILMLNRHSSPNMGKWNGIGGKLEAGETPLESVIREAFEETGIRIENPEWVGKVTWVTEQGVSGMDVFLSSLSTDYDYVTPRNVDEGILDWKTAEWILNIKNTGIADNIQDFLPIMLNGELYDHTYTFDAKDQIINYNLMPLLQSKG